MTRSPIRLAYLGEQSNDTGASVKEIDFSFLSTGQPFKASRFIVEAGGHTDPEKHPEREVWLIAQGTGKLRYRGEVTDVGGGDCLTFDPDCEHSVSNTGAVPMQIFSVWWFEQRRGS